MRTIIAGTRTFVDATILNQVLDSVYWNPTVVLCGMANGADTLGEDWGLKRNIPVEYYPANWHEYGKKAGYIRNEVMAKHADALVVFWLNKSRGTQHMIELAGKHKLSIYVWTPTRQGYV